ncbi:zinc finger, CCHC-type containing protein [Tanacetum coccineum]|uniref:Zinc finger, CCHC-type containing protein n=1 Tax=Tanacetum coccineum TaxID=301880 RepID=A0ABQ5HY74_9ASTR
MDFGFEDPNQHLKDFLKLVDSLDLDSKNRERTRLRLFQFFLRDQASNWLERLPAGSITTWEDLTTRFLAKFFPPGRTAKLCNDILMFQQHLGESLFEAWNRFKELLQKVPHHGIDLWLQVQIFYDHVNPVTRRTINQSTSGKLRNLNAEESWGLLEDLSLYDNESWNDDEVFLIWKAFGRITHDLGSFREETDKTTDLHQHLSRISLQWLETASQIQCDAVTKKIKTASEFFRRLHNIADLKKP